MPTARKSAMSRKYLLVAKLFTALLLTILFLISQVVFVGTPRRPMTVAQADALVRRELPANSSVSQVKTWLDVHQIEHSGYGPHRAGCTDGVMDGITRDTGRPGAFISADIEMNFTFDKQCRLTAYSSHEVLTGP